jgi:hypothetical protein
VKRVPWPERLLFLAALVLAFCVGKTLVRPHPAAKLPLRGCDAGCIAATLDDQASIVRNGVLQVLTNNNMLEGTYPLPPHMSFARPGTKDYGFDPKYEVFNPAGGHVAAPPFPFFITNGNRIDGQGSDAPDMLLVAPVNEDVCRAVAAKNGGGIELSTALSLAPYPKTAAQSPVLGKPENCVEYDGRYYFYYMLLPE